MVLSFDVFGRSAGGVSFRRRGRFVEVRYSGGMKKRTTLERVVRLWGFDDKSVRRI